MTPQIINWYLCLGVFPMPKHWERHKEPEMENKTPRKHPSGLTRAETERMTDKLQRGIKVIVSRGDIKHRDEVYQILKERDFLPVFKDGKHMSESRFHYYYSLVCRQNKITFPKNFKTTFIKANYKKMSVNAMAEELQSKPIYIQQAIAKIKRDLRK